LSGVRSEGSKGASHTVEAADVDEGEVEVVVAEPLQSNTVDEDEGEVIVTKPLEPNAVDKGEAK
jgi:hypothetical protein